MKYVLNNENHKDLTDGLEYMVQRWCDSNHISGELAWLVIQSHSTARLKMFDNRL